MAPETKPTVSSPTDRELSWPRQCSTLIAAAGILPFAALLVLFVFDVPIGQPFFLVYRYSSFVILRIAKALPAIAISVAAIAMLYRAAARNTPPLGTRTKLLLLACYALLAAWTFAGPPFFVEQHAFNMLSPSHEGAFVLEARGVESVRDYVSRDFYARLQLSPEEMRGRRVLSNPPGMTVAAVLVRQAVESVPWLHQATVAAFNLGQLDDEQQQAEVASALLLTLLLTLTWSAAILPAYWSGRLWFPKIPALCLALGMVFNPSTVTFTPGKDPAQLLTVCVILAGWLSGYAQRRSLHAALAGLTLVAGMAIGLVHIWVLTIAAAATLAHACVHEREKLLVWVVHCCIPCGFGVLAALAFAYLLLDWNLVKTVAAVAARYGEIQLPIITEPFYWTLVGLPMFLLFVGPMFWMLLALREPRDLLEGIARPPHQGANTSLATQSLGQWLLWVTIAVMTYSYFFANNSETPRLFMPFIPPLLLGMALRQPAFQTDSARTGSLVVWLMAMQLLLTIAFWTLMDVRESEWRLFTGRMWD